MGSEVISYKVLARKYRPKSFKDLIGQDLLVKTLTNAFKVNRIAHAFILTGIRGVGKTTTARIISACLNCTGSDGLGGLTIEPCGICDSCESISRGNNVDVLEVDAASRTGVADVREIIDSVKYKPASARYKVFIIDEVHMLSNSAFNALLKTLEEPPEHTKFIFATTEIHKIPITVISRCQRYDLNRVSTETLMVHLKNILNKEGRELDENILSLIIRGSEGSVRDALSILDQIILQNEDTIDLEEIHGILGVSDRYKLIDLFELILNGDIQKSLALLRVLFKNGGDPTIILKELSEIIHWITSLKVAPDLSKDLLFTSGEKEKGQALSKKIPLNVLTMMWQVLTKSLDDFSGNINHFSHTEMSIIRLTTISNLPTPIEIIRDLKALSDGNQYKPDEKKKCDEDFAQVGVTLDKYQEQKINKTEIQGEDMPSDSVFEQNSSRGDSLNDTRDAVQGAHNLETSNIESSGKNAENKKTLSQASIQTNDILDFLKKSKEIPLLVEVENFVRFVSCSFGEITVEIDKDCPLNLVPRLSKALLQVTGIDWEIKLIENSGKKTTKEHNIEKATILEKKLVTNEVVRSVLDIFPDSEVFFDDKKTNV